MRETRVYILCDLCLSSGKQGYLWLGGKDYVECPQCFGTGRKRGRLEIVEQVITPSRIFVVGGGKPLTRVEAR